MSLVFDEYGRPYVIIRDQEQKSRLKGLDAQKVRQVSPLPRPPRCSRPCFPRCSRRSRASLTRPLRTLTPFRHSAGQHPRRTDGDQHPADVARPQGCVQTGTGREPLDFPRARAPLGASPARGRPPLHAPGLRARTRRAGRHGRVTPLRERGRRRPGTETARVLGAGGCPRPPTAPTRAAFLCARWRACTLSAPPPCARGAHAAAGTHWPGPPSRAR
jgi:hypothetical protein